MERTEKIADYFQYELTPLPTSLFKGYFMGKSKKSSLATYMNTFSNRNNKRKRKVNKGFHTRSAKHLYMENLECSKEENQESNEAEIQNDEEIQGLQHLKETDSIFVIDRDALLHRVVWNTARSYGEILRQYKRHIESNYEECIIVFDGYLAGPSTKHHEHQRRKNGCANITIDVNFQACESQHIFLLNDHNKSRFIDLLSEHLVNAGHQVKKINGDADTLIVSTTKDMAIAGKNAITVADDTDVLVMLLHFWNSEMVNISLLSRKKAERLIDIGEVADKIDWVVLRSLLFIHAFCGCDTTSTVHGKRKTSIVRLLQKNQDVKEACKTFMNESATKDEVKKAGCLVFVLLYGGRISDTLSHLRYLNYKKLAATTKKSLPENYHHLKQRPSIIAGESTYR